MSGDNLGLQWDLVYVPGQKGSLLFFDHCPVGCRLWTVSIHDPYHKKPAWQWNMCTERSGINTWWDSSLRTLLKYLVYLIEPIISPNKFLLSFLKLIWESHAKNSVWVMLFSFYGNLIFQTSHYLSNVSQVITDKVRIWSQVCPRSMIFA